VIPRLIPGERAGHGAHSPTGRQAATVPLRPAPKVASGLPAYNIALAPGPLASDSRSAVVRATATGEVLATVEPPRPYRAFTWVTAAADDRTFALAAELIPPGAPPQARGATAFFLLRLDPAAGTARISKLSIPVLPDPRGMGSAVSGIALSPDGGKLAVALGNTSFRAVIKVFDLRTGAVKSWRGTRRGNVTADELGANPLSWTADGRTLAYDEWIGNNLEVRLLDTNAPAGSLAASKLAITFHDWPNTGSVAGSAIITPDGTKIIAMAVPGAGNADKIQANEFSTATGKQVAVLARLRYQKHAITGWPNVLWTDSSGSRIIVKVTRLGAAPGKNGGLTAEEIGIMTRNRFTPLRGLPGGEVPVW
jgi:DNA-binding beta-propeller fold protein YncE